MRLFLVPLLFLAVPLLCASALMSEEESHGRRRLQEEGGEVPMRSPVVSGPTTGGKEDITGSNDVELANVDEFARGHLLAESDGLHFVLFKAEVQVVAGLMYTLQYKGSDGNGDCQEEHTVVVYTKPWLNERLVKSDTKRNCGGA
ncbi:unnamed protein product [Laminaria digitata]